MTKKSVQTRMMTKPQDSISDAGYTERHGAGDVEILRRVGLMAPLVSTTAMTTHPHLSKYTDEQRAERRARKKARRKRKGARR